MSTYVSKSVADMKASFQYPILPLIADVNIDTLMDTIKLINRNARSVKSRCGNFGYLFLTMSAEAYRTYEQDPVLPTAPTDIPIFTSDMDAGERATVKMSWEQNKME